MLKLNFQHQYFSLSHDPLLSIYFKCFVRDRSDTFTVRHGIQETKHKQSLVILCVTVQCVIQHVQEGPRTTNKMITAILSFYFLEIMQKYEQQNNVCNVHCAVSEHILHGLSVANGIYYVSYCL